MQCPVCSRAVKTSAVHSYSAEQAAAHFCPLSRDADRNSRLRDVVRRLWGGNTGEVYVCQECGFGFGWPHVGGDEEYYAILHEQAGYPSDRWEYGVTIDNVMPRFPEGGNVLDIGTGDGSFLKKLPATWVKHATEGSDTTRQRLREAGIQCFASTADAVTKAAGTFQIVTMFQVLEHVAGFHALLADCFRLLQPGGAIVISVPLAASMFAQERLTGCQDMIPNHINKWSPASLALALRNNGFEPDLPLIEPSSIRSAAYRAGLMTRAQAASHSTTLAAKVYGIRNRGIRLSFLAAISGLNLLRRLPVLSEMMTGSSFLMMAQKPETGTSRR